MTYGQRMEEEFFQHSGNGSVSVQERAKFMFDAVKQAGNNKDKLARLLITWDYICTIMNWPNENLSELVSRYQASVDAKFHNDYKAVATIEELDNRMATRRSSGLLRQNNGGPNG